MQCACLLGFALSHYTSSSEVTIFEYLGTLFSTANLTYDVPNSQSLPSSIVSTLPVWVDVLTVLAIVAAACWEASRFPRLGSHGTGLLVFRTLLQMLGDLLLSPVRAIMPAERPVLDYQHTPENERILAMCPSLQYFKQTAWLHNSLLSFVVLMFSDFVFGPMNVQNVRRELVTADDGGLIALDWWEPQSQVNLAGKPRKILFIGSTFTGDALVSITRETCEYFTALGFRCVVYVKRGCGLTMPNVQPRVNAAGTGPVRPWCLSGLQDFELAVDHVAACYPEAVICGIGFSTGAGQMRNYVNSRGTDSKLAAAVIADAAPRWSTAMVGCDNNLPLISKALVAAARMTFQNIYHDEFAQAKLEASTTKSTRRYLSGGMMEFVEELQAPGHGFESNPEGTQKYYDSCQPADAAGSAVPVLELLTYNDTLITPDMQDITRKSTERSLNTIVATTRNGTHMVRWEGLIPQCWLRKAAGEFLEAALKVTGKNNTFLSGQQGVAM